MDSMDYDILAYLAERGPSTPGVLARCLRASGPYLRRRLGFLVRRGVVERAGWGLYRLREPPAWDGPARVAFEKFKVSLSLRRVPPGRTLAEGVGTSKFGSRARFGIRAGSSHGP